MTSGSSNFSDFPENKLAKNVQFKEDKANREWTTYAFKAILFTFLSPFPLKVGPLYPASGVWGQAQPK